jgi:hypothetical protein
MIHGGVDPDLLGEVAWCETDDLWWWGLHALVVYARAASDHSGESVEAVCRRIAECHAVDLTTEPP